VQLGEVRRLVGRPLPRPAESLLELARRDAIDSAQLGKIDSVAVMLTRISAQAVRPKV
jgi:hypothetical protein